MHRTQKNKQWYFGMKVHVGASKRGLVHSVATGPANEADITRLEDLLHAEQTELYGDQASGARITGNSASTRAFATE